LKHFSLSGLVAVTASCAVIEPWAAIIIGAVSGWVYIIADLLLIRLKLDDAVAAIQVHLANGFWGVIATGLLASPNRLLDAYNADSHPGFFYAPGSANLLPAQLAGAVFIIAWTLVTTLPFFVLLDFLGLFRVNALEELVGLDASYCNFNEAKNNGDDPSDEDEEVRIAAYRQRFAERKLIRENQTTKIVDDVLNQSWGNGECNLSVFNGGPVVEPGDDEAQQLTFQVWLKQQQGYDLPVSEQAPQVYDKANSNLLSI
jgi:Ammonium Transporter Family